MADQVPDLPSTQALAQPGAAPAVAPAPSVGDLPSTQTAAAPAAAPAPAPAAPVGTGTEIAQTLDQLNNVDYSSLVLARRIAAMQKKNPRISASLSFDVAAGLNDSTANSIDLSPDLPTYAQPNALSVLVHNAISTTPAQGVVSDLQGYQQNLQSLGYLPADYQPSGVWDQTSANASYQYTSDVASQIRQGSGRLGSVTAGDALKFLNMTMPTGIWKTVVGMAHGLVKSMSNTGKDLWVGASGLVEGQSAHEMNQRIKAATGRDFSLGALGEDAMNVLTLASMATGIGELGAVITGAGETMGLGGLAAQAAKEGLGSIIKPVPGETGVMGRSFAAVLSKFGGQEAKESALEFMGKYGPKALARAPLMETVGRGYGALRWAVLPQTALATFDPHSVVGAAAAKAKAPAWLDVPVALGAIEPGAGIVATGKRLLGVSRVQDALSILPEAFLGLPKDAYWTEGQRAYLSAGAYVKAVVAGQAGDAATYAGIGARDGAAWNAAHEAGGLTADQHRSNQVARLVNRVVDNIDDPTNRQLTPAFLAEAQDWAAKNPADVAAHYLDLVNSGAFRDANGLKGMNEWEAYDQAARIADEVTRSMPPGQIQEAQGSLFALRAAPAPDEVPQLTGEAPPGRILAMRADNPGTRENIDQLAKQWDIALNGVKAPDGTVIAPPNPQAQIDLETEIRKLPGMAALPSSDYAAQLTRASRNAPQDASFLLPASTAEEMSKLGYKAVLGSNGVLLPSDLGAIAQEAPKLKRAEFALSNLGLSPTPVDGARLVRATQANYANQYLAKLDPAKFGYGEGERMLQAVSRSFAKTMGDRAELVGEGANKVTRMVDRLGRTIQTSQGASMAFMRNVLAGPEFNLDANESGVVARALYAALKDGAASPGLASRPSGILAPLHVMAAGMRVNGFTGVMDALRAFTLSDVPALGSLLPDHYGYLFDTPMKLAGALRFQLNPLFELRRLTKGEQLAGEYEELSPSIRPWKAMQQEDWMGNIPAGEPRPTGYEAHPGAPILDRYSQIFTRTQGQDVAAVNDIDRAFKQSGVFGYNMQHHAIYDVGRIWDRSYTGALRLGKSADEATTIADAYAAAHGPKLYTFGGKSPLMRSANFLFFPFSFETKVASAAAEYLTARPTRLFLTHEIARRLQQLDQAGPGQKSKFAQIANRYAPVLNDLTKLNAFRSGFGPGEFLGLYRPLAEAMSLPVESVANALHPGLIPAGDVTTFKNLLPRALPGISAVSQFFKDLNATAQVATSPSHQTASGQIDNYYTLKDGIESNYSDMGRAYGTDGTITAFQSSPKVPAFLKVQYQTDMAKLGAMYPAGATYAAQATSRAAVQQANIDALLNKTTKSIPEQAVVSLETTRLELGNLSQLGQVSPVMKQLSADITAKSMHAAAVRLYQAMGPADQAQFANLWVALGYQSTYGPLAIPLAGGKDIGMAAA